ncbi:amino acid permease [Seiridium cupressi]
MALTTNSTPVLTISRIGTPEDMERIKAEMISERLRREIVPVNVTAVMGDRATSTLSSPIAKRSYVGCDDPSVALHPTDLEVIQKFWADWCDAGNKIPAYHGYYANYADVRISTCNYGFSNPCSGKEIADAWTYVDDKCPKKGGWPVAGYWYEPDWAKNPWKEPQRNAVISGATGLAMASRPASAGIDMHSKLCERLPSLIAIFLAMVPEDLHPISQRRSLPYLAAMDTEKTGGLAAVTSSDNASGEIITGTTAEYGTTVRGLSPRHVQLMAIGGSIGTGLWVGIGGVLSKAGPLSLILGYTFWGLLYIWPLNLSVAEMCAYLPIRGSIFELASRFVDPALGFAMGWTYFFAGVMLVCTEYSAVATVMQYWNADINPAAWIAMAMVVCFLLNVVAVKWYGESEFVMASTKVLLLFGLCLVTLITMSGGNPNHDAYGFRNWGSGNAMHEYYTTGDTGRFLGWFKVVIYAAFTIAGPDMIALAAGEIQNPRRTIPRVAKLIFYRLVGFYVVGVLCVGIICSSRDPMLLGAIENSEPGAAASPWVVGIKNLGIGFLPDLVNALIMISGLSCGNAYLYSSSRTLYGLAKDGQAPRFLMKCTKSGVPIYSVIAVSLIACITFLVSSNSAVEVFYWFVDLTTTALIMTYTMMLIAFIGFYRARVAQGLDPKSLPYRAPWAPYTAYFALMIGILALIFVGYNTFVPFDSRSFVTAYFGLAFGIFMYFAWKVVKRTSIVKPAEADLISGKEEVDKECRHWEEGGIEEVEKERLAQMSFAKRCWERMW